MVVMGAVEVLGEEAEVEKRSGNHRAPVGLRAEDARAFEAALSCMTRPPLSHGNGRTPVGVEFSASLSA